MPGAPSPIDGFGAGRAAAFLNCERAGTAR
ncbi:hypothetical protein PLANTIT3_100104 [Plantibacter sp. T3]|nr:hypothetical protein PLANTIT3_100104 [Plantibacter sp. T3]